MYILCLVAAAT